MEVRGCYGASMLNVRENKPDVTPVASSRIAEAAARLHVARPEATIVLFGSQARGEARADSDVDFLVVLPEAPASARQEMARLTRIFSAARPFSRARAFR